MRIALTNDDGIYASGLRAIYKALKKKGHEVQVIAPMTEQSAVGHAITVISPLRVKKIDETDFQGYGIFGTPTDCVKLGINRVLSERPDMVVSGINAGANVGPDILYSGTVAAATEAAHQGFPAVAVSFDSFKETVPDSMALFAVDVIEKVAEQKQLPSRCVMNLNLPNCGSLQNMKGLQLCEQTKAVWHDWYDHREDPRGRDYWWLNGDILPEHVAPETDKWFIEQGYATLTPLKFDFTDRETLALLRGAF